jgi:hypothetical protein
MPASPTFAIVTTTINVPHLLDAYVEDALAHDRALVGVFVAGDRKTAAGAAGHCDQLAQRTGVRVEYQAPDEQERYLDRWPELRDFLPWNSIQRRNVAMLAAYESQADIVVTIDDDNFLEQPDYLGAHAHLGETLELETAASDSGWWNVCELLDEERGIPFYHRGYPLSQRWRDGRVTRSRTTARAIVNAGLWLGDPDVDALSRLYWPVNVTKPSRLYADRVACAVGTWCPFDSQNTALLREVVPAYVLLPEIGRYDDIWASYIVRRLSDVTGDVVTYGAPLVRQERNAHDYFKDFDAERFGLQNNERFVDALHACEIDSGSYAEMFSALSAQLPRRLPADGPYPTVQRGLSVWADVFAQLDGG